MASKLTAAQLAKLAAAARTHPDLEWASTSDGIILARWLTAWIRDGYRATIRGELHEIPARPDHEPITYCIPAHGRILGYCKEKPLTEREQALCGSLDNPLPAAARRLSFKAYDPEQASAELAKARKREAA